MKTVAFFLVTFYLVGCASSHGPAPVADITGTTSYKRNTYLRNIKQETSEITSKSYQVKKGDTLFSISWRANLDINDLAKYNQLSAPYIIREGQTLILTASTNTKTKTHTNTKTVFTKKPTAKIDSPSQNNKKSSCTDQSCNKNTKTAIVQKNPITYSSPTIKSDGKITTPKDANVKISDWQWPAKGRLTKTFAASQNGMKGISLSNKRGTPIYTAAPGEVVYAGSGLRGFGNLIIIKHNDDYLSAYAHNEQLLVREKQQIKAGQKIAIMGDSGTDSVKLHFEIRYQGKSIDPLRYLPKR